MPLISKPKTGLAVIINPEAVNKVNKLLRQYQSEQYQSESEPVTYDSLYEEFDYYIKNNSDRYLYRKENIPFKIKYYDVVAAVCKRFEHSLYIEDFVRL